MSKIEVYSSSGNKKTNIPAPLFFKEKVKLGFLSQAIKVYEDRKHPGLAKTKTRGEVRGSTKKIYRQKGTGFARHGARSAPIFMGGGIAHGPTGIKKTLSLPSKMKVKALRMALTYKLKEQDIVAVDSLSSFKKTSEAADFIKKVLKKLEKKNKRITFVVKQNGEKFLSLMNIKGSKVKIFQNLNAYDVFYGGLLIFDSSVLKKEKDLKANKKVIRKA